MPGFPGPSTYTPLFRRFTNERQRELLETQQLYARIRLHHEALGETMESMGRRIYARLPTLAGEAETYLIHALYDLTAAERQIWEMPELELERLTMAEFVEFRNFLYRKEHFFANKASLLQQLEDGAVRVLTALVEGLPKSVAPTPFTVPLALAHADPKGAITDAWDVLTDYYDQYLFRDTTEQFWRNICAVSGRDPDDPQSKKPAIAARDSAATAADVSRTYLADTPFEQLFSAAVPLRLTHDDRFNHWHILAGSGVGKTVLIENLIRHDLASDDPPSIVLIDPHSDLVRKLVSSDLGLGDRLILIDPRDTKYPVALNPFAVNRERLSAYDETTREQVTAGVIQTFGYLFSGLTNLTLTGKQDVFFRYVTRLMLSLPDTMGKNATILDMLKLMHDPTPYGEAIAVLPEIQRDFFMRDFTSKTFEATKDQIRYRLQAIIENPTMARLFNAPETKVDLFTEMNRGAVILVDTAKDFLKEGSATFGKLIISLVLQAVLERAAIPEEKRKPTFVIVDEAGSFFSSNIDDLLTEARKYKCGLVLAHQYLDQASGALRSSLAANTGIKFASGLSAADAASMARDMRTTPDFILSQPKLQFAAHIRNVTTQAVSIPLRPVRDPPLLSQDDRQKLIDSSRSRVAMQLLPPPPAPVELASVPEAPTEEWGTQ